MVLSAEQERVRSLIADTVSLLCKNGLHYTKEFSIEGLLGITLDRDEVFLVNIKEIVKSELSKDDSDSGSASEESTMNPKSPSARRRRRKRQRKSTVDGAGHEVESESDNETNSSLPHTESGEPRSKNIKQENDDSGDDLVFVKNEPGNNFHANLSAISGATAATNDILSDLSQQGQLYATPTSNPLPGPSWDPSQVNSSLYNTLPNQQQPMNVMSPTTSPGGSMQQIPPQQVPVLQQLPLPNTLACKFCGKPFRSEQGLKDHENAHKGKFRYTCPHCSRGFVAINHYKEHLTGHTGVGYFTCRLCGEKLPSQYQMKIHKNREHPEDGDRAIVQRGGLSAVELSNMEARPHVPYVFPPSLQPTASSSTDPPMFVGSPDMSYGEMIANQILVKAGLKAQPAPAAAVQRTSVSDSDMPAEKEPAKDDVAQQKDTNNEESSDDTGSDSDT